MGPDAGLDRVREDWTRLGSADPLWAVLVSPEHRGGRWDPAVFLATGRAEVDAVWTHLTRLGIAPVRGRAIDFGCGAGRLTQALTAYADEVVGIDVSAPMLERARGLDRTGRCTFVLNDRPDLSAWADAGFDLAYSSLVLQHLPAALTATYLSELVRVLRPGGVLVAQVATRPDASVRGRIARVAPRAALRIAQRRVLGYPAPMDMHATSPAAVADAAARHGGRVVDATDEPMYGGHWHYRRYFVVRA